MVDSCPQLKPVEDNGLSLISVLFDTKMDEECEKNMFSVCIFYLKLPHAKVFLKAVCDGSREQYVYVQHRSYRKLTQVCVRYYFYFE